MQKANTHLRRSGAVCKSNQQGEEAQIGYQNIEAKWRRKEIIPSKYSKFGHNAPQCRVGSRV